jgi:hypothetical protein
MENLMSDDIRQIEINWREVTKMILHANGITTGLWSPGIKTKFANAMLGPTLEESLPSGVVSVSGIRLRQVTSPGPLVFDAAELIKEDITVEVVQPIERKPRKKLSVDAEPPPTQKATAVRKRKPGA